MIVLGNDAHKGSITAVATNEAGVQLDHQTVAARHAGFATLLAWARAKDEERVWAVEDVRHLSEPFVRYLLDQGELVVRVPPKLMARQRRSARTWGKSDPIDALAVARALLREPELPVATIDDAAREIRLLVDHREDLVGERTRMQNRLRWHLHDWDPDLNIAPRTLDRGCVLDQLARRLARAEQTTLIVIARELVRDIRARTRRIKELERQIDKLTAQRNPHLRAVTGIGPIAAGVIAGHTAGIESLQTESDFAMFCGVAPLDASSGRQQRHRLNRHGDRDINCVLHRAVLTQLQRPGQAREYAQRRTTEGKTPPEIRRCLKRYIARAVFRALIADTKYRQHQEQANMIKPLTTPQLAVAA